jgi:hypothetical protein
MDNTGKPVNRWANRTNRPGRKAKRASELAVSTFSQRITLGKLPYSPLFAESVNDLFDFDLSDSARLTWLRLQPLFANRVSPGNLVDERTNGATSLAILAAKWRKQESELVRDMEELDKCRLIVKSGEFWSDPMMVAFYDTNNPTEAGSDENIITKSERIIGEESRGEESRGASVSTDTDALSTTSTAPLVSADAATASLANDGRNSGSVSDPIPPRSEPIPLADIDSASSEEQEAYIGQWVEYLRYSEPSTLLELEIRVGKCLNVGWIVSRIIKRAAGLISGVRATMVEISDDKYAGVDWLRQHQSDAT